MGMHAKWLGDNVVETCSADYLNTLQHADRTSIVLRAHYAYRMTN